MINIIIGSFIGCTLSSIITTAIKAFAIKRIMNSVKDVVTEIQNIECTDEK